MASVSRPFAQLHQSICGIPPSPVIGCCETGSVKPCDLHLCGYTKRGQPNQPSPADPALARTRNAGGLLRDALEPTAVLPGAVLVAGTERFWSVVRIEQAMRTFTCTSSPCPRMTRPLLAWWPDRPD